MAGVLLACTGVPLAAAPGDKIPSLREFRDGDVQVLLDRSIARLGLQRAVARRQLAVALVDLGDIERPRVAEVNGDQMMYAASLPKIGILLAAFVEIERGRLGLSRWLREMLTDMIRVSSNPAATIVMNLVGKRHVNEILASERFRLYDPRENGGIWVGKEYGKSPAFERDPLHNISHGATAMQVAKFFYLLESGRLLNPELTRLMKDTLSRPGIPHKFVKGLAGRDVELYRKSGTWQQWHADSALVVTPRGKYVIVALASHPAGGEWLTRLAPTVHDMLEPVLVAARSPVSTSIH